MAQDLYKYFRPEARELVDQFSRGVLDLEKGESNAATVQRLLRLAHTLKGAARIVKQAEIANRAHAIEDALSPFRDSTENIAREHIERVFEHIEAISDQLATLGANSEASASGSVPAAATSAADEAPRTVRANLAETDAVLDSVAETHALVGSLRAVADGVQQTRKLADLLSTQFMPLASAEHDRRSNGRASQRISIADELRRKIGGVERTLESTIDQIDRELRQLREAAERLRLVPAGNLFVVLERTARDTARAVGKEVEFSAAGGEIRLDAHMLEILQGALVQIIRNAVAHGIEKPDERTKAGKPSPGRVSVLVSRRDRRIVFTCKDDGRGVDLEAVRRLAAQRGIAESSGPEFRPDDIVRVLLRAGISTSKTVTEVSGRGVGLDVVREAIERLSGEVGLNTVPGAGTTFELIIPPSLASLEALMVEVGAPACTVAIPLDAVRSTMRLAPGDISVGARGALILHDQKAIAFTPLSTALDGTAWVRGRVWTVVIVEGTGGCAAIGVERLTGTQKIVVRPLPQRMAANPIVTAAALDADGNPQLMLDPDRLVEAAQRGQSANADSEAQKRTVLVVDDSLTTRMLEQSILESAGYDVDLALSGEEALQRVRDKSYALILVDVEMPGMDGFTFIERIRAEVLTRDIPAILVTSLAEPEHRQRGRDVGAQGYIIKSEFNQAELLSMIKSMME